MTNLPANVDTAERPRKRAARRPLRAQAADLRARYDALPKRQQWLVLGAMVLVGRQIRLVSVDEAGFPQKQRPFCLS
jgi:hypothetical protein